MEIIDATDKGAVTLSLRAEELRNKQTRLYLQMLGVFRKIELMRNRGKPVQGNERRYREHLDQLCMQVMGPSQKLQEIMTLKVMINNNNKK